MLFIDVNEYILGELAKKTGLLTGKRRQKKKTFMSIENYVYTHHRLWVKDFYDYIHEGGRVDNANLLNIYCFISARCQEVCQARYKVCCLYSYRVSFNLEIGFAMYLIVER
jgi:hypothetical protein